MPAQQLSSRTGAVIEENAIQEFQASLRGDLVRPGDPAYAAARQIYNAMIDKHPEV